VATLPADGPVVFVLGALAHGSVEAGYVDEVVSFSGYPLSGSVAAGKVMNAFENLWGIL
jgi:rRNA small subunit pseudouridine methyltransferase Nep1